MAARARKGRRLSILEMLRVARILRTDEWMSNVGEENKLEVNG